jgi:hypothetical protein
MSHESMTFFGLRAATQSHGHQQNFILPIDGAAKLRSCSDMRGTSIALEAFGATTKNFH